MDMIPLYVSGFLYILDSMRFHLIKGLQQKMFRNDLVWKKILKKQYTEDFDVAFI